MPEPGDRALRRHGHRPRAARLRGLLRGVVVGLLAVPSVLGVTSVLGLSVGAHSASAAARSADPTSGAGPTADRSAVRVGRPAPGTPTTTPTTAPPAGGGSVPAPPPQSVVGLGDSVPAGSACGCSDYVSLLAQSLGENQGSTVHSSNLATPGETSDGLLAQLASPGIRSAVAGADVVVVTIGANDVEGEDPTSCPPSSGQDSDEVVGACYAQQLDTLTANLDRALGQLTALPRAPGARVLVTGYWNVFLDGAVGRAKGLTYAQLADAATRAVNARIAAAAKAHGATFVDLFTPFRGSDGSRDCTDLLAPDGDHPDADGHVLIARTLAAAL
jgi:lysophospholipase L1-like esterase